MVEIKSKICYNKGSQKARIKVSSFNNSVMYFLNNVMYSDESPTEEVGLFFYTKIIHRCERSFEFVTKIC